MSSLVGECLAVEIERILPGGLGLAHAAGKTLFVSLAAPGDKVRVQVEREQGNVLFASVVEILTPSSVRVEPPCPYFGRCGGCDFQQLTYEAQLAAKAEIIGDCLQRIARLDHVPEIEVQPSPHDWRYRVRATWQIDREKQTIGYYERGSRRVCDVVAGENGVSLAPEFAEFRTNELSLRVGNEVYRYNAESFFQINPALVGKMIEFALRDAGGETALDLYCGVGLFTLPLARRFAKVVGVEANSAAVRFAKRNLQDAELANARVVNAGVADWIRRGSQAMDFVLLDPPRAGAESIVIKGILNLHPERISYVSCDPATLARDLKKLIAAGYSIDSIRGFDLFPQTHHVETVVLLRRLS